MVCQPNRNGKKLSLYTNTGAGFFGVRFPTVARRKRLDDGNEKEKVVTVANVASAPSGRRRRDR